ncbi:MAG: 6,7-dimethyl-8-ribityllumazine synthase [Ignavibacteria bacterium]|jgi:6,7-dimethyl-8-ribityllumazine synthase|nr:6,7-dimethyl-8-ribityllumazine synthase [Ignavibacteria bacterium]
MKSNYKIAVISSRFNPEITGNLIKGAVKLFSENSIAGDKITFFNVPGAFEIPSVLEKICKKNSELKYDGILTIGCVIKGETAHFEYISSAVSGNINRIASEYSVPVGFCVLTCYTDEQAEARSRMDVCNSETNKGYEAASALLEMIDLMKKI